MDYFQNNKAAWEEAFVHRHSGWGDENYKRLMNERLPFLDLDVAKAIEEIDLNGKKVAQFCCNNGRELLSLMQLGVKLGVGFDIAENILEQAIDTAEKAGIHNCQFVSSNILDIPQQYNHYFDFVFFTCGAITWFEDVVPLFQKVFDCLQPGGLLLIHDYHPFTNMLPIAGDREFDKANLNKVVYSYFRKEPWLENEGMGYMSEQYASKTFTSFTHTMSDIINSINNAKMRVVKLNEYDYDVGLCDAYNGMGFPLSYLLIAEKQACVVTDENEDERMMTHDLNNLAGG